MSLPELAIVFSVLFGGRVDGIRELMVLGKCLDEFGC